MKKTTCISAFLILNLAAAKSAFCQRSPKAEIEALRKTIQKTHQDLDWNAYDPSSTVAIDSIDTQAMQGLWKTYNGIFKFNGSVNSMALTTPLVIEIKEDGLRTGSDSTFKKFGMTKNLLELKEEDRRGYINKITDHLLVITWNSGDNRFRYYYEKQ